MRHALRNGDAKRVQRVDRPEGRARPPRIGVLGGATAPVRPAGSGGPIGCPWWIWYCEIIGIKREFTLTRNQRGGGHRTALDRTRPFPASAPCMEGNVRVALSGQWKFKLRISCGVLMENLFVETSTIISGLPESNLKTDMDAHCPSRQYQPQFLSAETTKARSFRGSTQSL